MRKFLIAALFIITAATFGPASAQMTGGSLPPVSLSMNTCAPGIPEWQVTTRVVTCIRSTLIMAATDFIRLLTEALRTTFGALFLLTVIFFGLRIKSDSDKGQLPQEIFSFTLRFALVAGFAFNMDQFVSLPFAITDDLVSLVSGGSPWLQIDTAIGQLMGFGPNLALYQGILGLVGAALFSSATGMFMFLFGLMVLVSLFGLFLRAIFTYLNAMLYMTMMTIFGAIAVPLAISGYTENRYFNRWMNVMIAVILQPVMLFAFLNVFMSMINVYIATQFNTLGGNDFVAYWRMNAPFFTWGMASDPSLFEKFENQGMQKGPPLVQQLMNPLLGRSMDMNFITHPGVDFGAGGQAMMQEIILNFIAMAIVCYMLRMMLEKIPNIADEIAGVATGIQFERLQFVDNIKRAVSQVKGGG